MTDADRAARVDAVLDALALERRPPGLRFFEDLFLRFQRRVAAETLTRPRGDSREFDAEGFFAEWTEEEPGLVGEERALAFEWLAAGCGFAVTRAKGRCRRPWEKEAPANSPSLHRAVVASVEGRRILADAAFPLPVLLPLDPPAQEIPTGFGMLSVSRSGGPKEVRVTCDARGEVADLLQLVPPLSEPFLPLEEICRTPPGASPRRETARVPFAIRVLDDRVLYWSAGRMTVLDAWSRLEYALPASERSALEKLFAIELEGVTFAREVDERSERAPATLSVFHLSPIPAEEARGRAGLSGPPLSLIASRDVRVEDAGTGSRITIEATFGDPVPAAGPGEAVRKTLVFHLVAGLFDLSSG